uniref:Uncharacterized protein n=1 Tax=Caenorhabditis japonica TaxID=281687 RepID=A0A8R1IAJ9_CAEJA
MFTTSPTYFHYSFPFVPVIETPTNVSEPQSKSTAPSQEHRITTDSHRRLTICVSRPCSLSADRRIDARPLHHRLTVCVLSSSAISIGLSRAAIFDQPCRAPISVFRRSRNLLEGPDTPIHRGEDKRRPQRGFEVRFPAVNFVFAVYILAAVPLLCVSLFLAQYFPLLL